MGILSSLKKFKEDYDERGRILDAMEEEKQQQKWEEELRDFIINGDYGAVNHKNLIDFFATSNLDRVLRQYAPKITGMIGTIYLEQEDVAKYHELEGRYEELKERYEELKKEYNEQSKLIADIAKKSSLTR